MKYCSKEDNVFCHTVMAKTKTKTKEVLRTICQCIKAKIPCVNIYRQRWHLANDTNCPCEDKYKDKDKDKDTDKDEDKEARLVGGLHIFRIQQRTAEAAATSVKFALLTLNLIF